MTARDIIRAITRSLWSPHKLTCAFNTWAVEWEADLLVLQPSGWLDEVEVKVSLSDFRADMRGKREKHFALQHGRPQFAMLRKGPGQHWGGEYFEAGDRLPIQIAHALRPDMYELDQQDCIPIGIRRFWFAVPQELAENVEAELPPYAGLIAAGTGAWRGLCADRIKPAPVLAHSRKASDEEVRRILQAMYHRAWDHFSSTYGLSERRAPA